MYNKPFICVVTAILLISSIITACQPTPETQVVIGIDEDQLLHSTSEQVLNTSESHPHELQLTETWVETFHPYEWLSCIADAHINITGVDTYPVFKFSRSDFSADTMKNLANAILIDPIGIRYGERTKAEITDELFRVHRGRSDYDANGNPIWVPYEGQEEDIRILEEQLAAAPDETYTDIHSIDIQMPGEYVYKTSNNKRWRLSGKDNRISLSAYDGVVQPESWVIAGEAYPSEPAGTTLDNVKISYDEAKEYAEAALEKLNIINMGVASYEKARILDPYNNTLSEGWQIVLTRCDGNREPVDYSAQVNSLLYYESEDFSAPLNNEKITLFIDEDGIEYLSWRNHIEIIETVNENVEVLPFSEITERIKLAIKLGTAWGDNKNMPPRTYQINDVKLSNCILPVKNEPQHGYLIPVWTVKCTCTIGEFEQYGMLCISAIDGSFVSPLYASN